MVLILAGCLLPLEGISERSWSENKIEAALNDKLYGLAERKARNLITKADSEDKKMRSRLLLTKILFGQGDYKEALQTAEKSIMQLPPSSDLQAGFIYWGALSLNAQGEIETAIEFLSGENRDHNLGPWSLKCERLLGKYLLQSGKPAQAQKIFELLIEEYSTDNQADFDRIYLAESYRKMNKIESFRQTLEKLIGEIPDSTPGREAQLRLSRHFIETGGEKEDLRAEEMLDNLSSAENEYRARAWSGKAALAEKRGELEEALAALEEASKLIQNPAERTRNAIKRAQILARNEKLNSAFELLESTIKNAETISLSAEAKLAKARILKENGEYSQATKAFQAYLEVSENKANRELAYSERGWCLLQTKHYPSAANSFKQAYQLAPQSKRAQRNLFKAAEALFAAEHYTQACEDYSKVARKMNNPLAPQAAYRAGICLLKTGDYKNALAKLQKLRETHPETLFAQKAALEIGRVHEKNGHWSKALEIYTEIGNLQPDEADLAPIALNRCGVINYRLNYFSEALDNFKLLLERYPDSQESEQAAYMKGFCQLMLGESEEALQTCLRFIEEHPKSHWTPNVLFWLGEYYFNIGDYDQAEQKFQHLVREFKDNDLSDRALYWCGQAAHANKKYLQAVEYYSQLAKQYPESNCLPEARFAQGDSLSELGEFARAILAFEEIIKSFPQDPLAKAAWGRKGDCNFTLASDDHARYEEASDSYSMLLKDPSTPDALQLQAQYKIGRCKEKLHQPDKALTHYMDVIYTYLNGELKPTPDTILWFTRAAFAAGKLEENNRNWAAATKIYKRIIEAGVPSQTEAKERLKRIQ